MARRLLCEESVEVQTMQPKTIESRVRFSQEEMKPVVEDSIGADDLSKDLESAPKKKAVVQAIWGRLRNGRVLCQK